MYHKVQTSFSWVFTSNAFIGIINFLSIIYFSRRLGPLVMGDYAIIIVGIDLFYSFFNFGFNQYVISKSNKGDSYNLALTSVFIQSLITTLIFIIFFSIYFSIDPVESQRVFVPAVILILARIISFYNALFYSKLEVNFQYKFISITRFISTSFGLAVAYFCLFSGAGLYTLIFRDISNVILFITIVYLKVRPGFKIILKKDRLKEIFNYSSTLWTLNFFQTIIQRIDYTVVGYLLGKEALGIYFAIRGSVEGLLGFVLNPIQTVLLPFFSSLNNAVDYFSKTIKKYAVFYFPLTIILIFMVYEFKSFLVNVSVGYKYEEGNWLLPGLTLYFCLIILFEIIKVFSLSQNLHKKMIVPRVFQLSSYLIFIYPCIYYLGFLGAGIATGFAALILGIKSYKVFVH